MIKKYIFVSTVAIAGLHGINRAVFKPKRYPHALRTDSTDIDQRFAGDG